MAAQGTSVSRTGGLQERRNVVFPVQWPPLPLSCSSLPMSSAPEQLTMCFEKSILEFQTVIPTKSGNEMLPCYHQQIRKIT